MHPILICREASKGSVQNCWTEFYIVLNLLSWGNKLNSADLTEQAKEFIVAEVSKWWTAEKKPLLLSTLGYVVRQKFLENTDTIIPNGLRRFLAEWPVVRVLSHPDIPQKVGAIPLDVPVPEDLASLFGRSSSPSERNETYGRAYDQHFWNTFVYGFPGKQFVIINKESKSWRLSEDTSNIEGEESYEIDRSYIVDMPRETPLNLKIPAVHSSINSWLLKNGLDWRIFASTIRRQNLHANDAISSVSRNDFCKSISKLDSYDLSRIFIPLDIVKRMIEG
jgi:hypothetical protein